MVGHRSLCACILVGLVGLSAGCVGGTGGSAVGADAERDGLTLRAEVAPTGTSLVVRSQVANERPDPVYLVPDQCGRVTEALLARTVFEPEGRAWPGSVGALKALVIRDQAFGQRPDRFHPRRVGDASSNVPDCTRLEGPLELAPGASIEERWELPLEVARTLEEVGSVASTVRVEAVEARGPEALELLDLQWAGTADAERAGRDLRVEVPASSVIRRAARSQDPVPSLAQLFDRLLEDDALRSWIEARPEDGWRQGDLSTATPDGPGVVLKAITTAYERPLVVRADPEGSDVVVELPTGADRTRVFPRRPATLPAGIPLIHEPDGWIPSQDVLPGEVRLPSGHIAVGEYLIEEERLDIGATPGAYPVRVTLATHERGGEGVALAALDLSEAETRSWSFAYAFPVDGGTTTITSVEGVAVLQTLLDRDADRWWRHEEMVWDSLSAHDHQVTEMPIEGELNLVMVSSGVGDGVYTVYVGRDAQGRPTQVVVDFLLLHLDWPASSSS